MNCPSCGQAASTFVRYSFSLQGVSFRDSVGGKFSCRSCGTLLRTTNYVQSILIMVTLAILFVAAYVLLFAEISSVIGFNTAYGLFIPLLLIAAYGGLFVIWKTASVEKAGAD